jgi:serine/threonine-protein kinase
MADSTDRREEEEGGGDGPVIPRFVEEEPDLVGTVLGKYRIEKVIGRGGMGTVYRAVHMTLGGQAAIKVLNAAIARNPKTVRRFFNEARAAAALKHGGIVEVLDFDQLPDGRPYMLMEYLEGISLHARLKRDRVLAPSAAVPILAAVCSAVGAAHRSGVVHRDLKPDNIFLVTRAGLKGVVKVLDFGIAKISNVTQPSERTQTGQIFGTPEYMSPEQAFGKHQLIGPASDIYSLGVIAYEMLCGTVPFPSDGLSFGDLMNQHAHATPPSLSKRRAEIPLGLDRVVLRALAKDIKDRWHSMEAFGEALTLATDPEATEDQLRILESADPFAQTTPPERMVSPTQAGAGIPSVFARIATNSSLAEPPPPRRRRSFVWVASALVVVAAGAVVVAHGLGAGGTRSGTPASTAAVSSPTLLSTAVSPSPAQSAATLAEPSASQHASAQLTANLAAATGQPSPPTPPAVHTPHATVTATPKGPPPIAPVAPASSPVAPHTQFDPNSMELP